MRNLTTGVIVANYNNGKYIDDCLTGLVNQTVKPDSIVIIDDGSTDNSKDKIIEALKSLGCKELKNGIGSIGKINVLVAFKDKNAGVGAARNTGIRYLKDAVDIIFIADADDVYYPKKIEESLYPFNRYQHVGLVYSDYDVFDEKTGISTREFKEPFDQKRLMQECIVSNNSAISSRIFDLIGMYDEELKNAEDYLQWLKISTVAAIYHIPKSLYKYRLHGNNVTVVTPKKEIANDLQKCFRKFQEHVKTSRS